MKRKNELGYKELKVTCDPKLLNFNTTDELEPISTGIGQERGINAAERGRELRSCRSVRMGRQAAADTDVLGRPRSDRTQCRK